MTPDFNQKAKSAQLRGAHFSWINEYGHQTLLLAKVQVSTRDEFVTLPRWVTQFTEGSKAT